MIEYKAIAVDGGFVCQRDNGKFLKDYYADNTRIGVSGEWTEGIDGATLFISADDAIESGAFTELEDKKP